MSDLTRRSLLVGLGAGAIAVACSGSDDPVASSSATTTTPSSTTTGSSPTTSAGAGAPAENCVVLPPSTAGPFGLEEQFFRRDITEGYPGHALQLDLQVVDTDCTAQPGAEVEIWHADATGDYSAFTDNGTGKDEGEGTTFLRGTQTTGDDGVAVFDTIVPGWYPGRAVHIHITVRLADGRSHTGQLFFDPTYLDVVYATEPYLDEGARDTRNERDSIARGLTTEMLLHPTAVDGGSQAAISLMI